MKSEHQLSIFWNIQCNTITGVEVISKTTVLGKRLKNLIQEIQVYKY